MDEAGLRALVAAWPGVEAGLKWDDDLCFTVAVKMFCVLFVGGTHAGRLSFKVEDARFLELTDRPGIIPAPYLARAHWITLVDPGALPPSDTSALVRRAYELVRARLPKRQQRELADD